MGGGWEEEEATCWAHAHLSWVCTCFIQPPPANLPMRQRLLVGKQGKKKQVKTLLGPLTKVGDFRSSLSRNREMWSGCTFLSSPPSPAPSAGWGMLHLLATSHWQAGSLLWKLRHRPPFLHPAWDFLPHSSDQICATDDVGKTLGLDSEDPALPPSVGQAGMLDKLSVFGEGVSSPGLALTLNQILQSNPY